MDTFGVNTPGYCVTFRRWNNVPYLDSTFHMGKANSFARSVENLPDGRMLVGGRFTQFNGRATGSLVRIWPEGELDTTFHSPIVRGYPNCYIHQPNGRIILGGTFVVAGDPDTMNLIRILPDGALDTTFHNHTQFHHDPEWAIGDFAAAVADAEQLEDGRLLVGGYFTHIDGYVRRGIALLDSTGHLITNLFNGQGCGFTQSYQDPELYSFVGGISPAPDGSIFVCGSFHGFDDGITNDTAARAIVKLYGLHVGVQEQAAMRRSPLVAFPNPTKDHLYLSWVGHTSYMVDVFDGDGRKVSSDRTTTGSTFVDVKRLEAGIYLVIATDPSGERSIIKCVKQ